MRTRVRVIWIAVVVLAVSGCSRSLFDAGNDRRPDGSVPDGSVPDGFIPETCPATCIASAATAFDGTVDGADGRWGYVGDRRNHTWSAMTPVSNAMVGDASNRIERCSSAASCGLPDALLVTSSGSESTSDPAVQYTTMEPRVIQIAVYVAVPRASVAHRVRLYRNSREDALFTAIAAPDAVVGDKVTVDALAGDRFLVALEPTSVQGGTAALQMFVSDIGKSFPSACQLALRFEDQEIVGPTVGNLCGPALTSIFNNQPSAPIQSQGPFAAQGMALHLEPGFYLFGSRPFTAGDVTIQFWTMSELTNLDRGVVFSDIDEDAGHGHRIELDNRSGLKLEAAVLVGTNPVLYAPQRVDVPNPTFWHFVRVVHTAGTVAFCLDGASVMSFPLQDATAPGIAPYLGRNGPWNPMDEFSGAIDDLRVFSTALPCGP
jgi:hypothetical protein